MNAESHELAALLASSIDGPAWDLGFGLGPTDADGRMLREAYTFIEGDVITIVVTDPFGGKREYIAAVHLAGEVTPDAAAHLNQFLRLHQFLRMKKRRLRDGWRRLRRIRARRLGT
ncbi:Uncharacterised protein [Mycolicibacterium flavescens]|nr:Uncharacterised protein [Mycolicibacterium flavescens]